MSSGLPWKTWRRLEVSERKFLVDTSAWIASFKRTGNEELKTFLREAIDRDLVVINPLIVLELLQGCNTQKEFDTLKRRLESLEILPLIDLSWDNAYSFGFSLRSKGLTIPTLDIVIAFMAMEKGYTLLHHDHHFRMIVENSELEAIDFLG